MRQYPLEQGNRIINFVGAAVLGAAAILFIDRSFAFHESRQVGPLLVLAALFIGGGFFIFFWTVRLYVAADDESIKIRTAFGSHELFFNDIDGYRTGDKGAFFLVGKDGKSVSLPKYIVDRTSLIESITSRYEDIDKRERDAETKTVLEDERYGVTMTERKKTLQNARIAGWTGNAVGIALCFFLIYFQQVAAFLYLALAAPWVAIFLTWRSRGMIRLSVKKSTPHPSVLFMMLFPSLVAAIYATRFHFYGFPSQAWLLIGAVTIAVALIATVALSGTIALEKRKTLIVVCLFPVAAAYSFGLTASTNCFLDESHPQTMTAQVIWKRINHGRSTSYDLVLSPWGKYADGNTVTIKKDVFYQIRRGDSVLIQLYTGKWGIPWYQVKIDATLIKPRAY
jgi:hypothetical protein